MRTGLTLLALALAACSTPAPVSTDASNAPIVAAAVAAPRTPAALHTGSGAPIVVVVETRDRSMAVTAALVRDPARSDLREMLAPSATASLDRFRSLGTLWAGL